MFPYRSFSPGRGNRRACALLTLLAIAMAIILYWPPT